MAERTAVWRIVTNFARARRDADRLSDSLERVRRNTEELDDSTVSGGEDSVKVTRTRTKAMDELARQSRAAAAAQKEQNKASEESVRTTQRQTTAEDQHTASVDRNTQSQKQNLDITKASAQAQQQLAQAKLGNQRATLALEAAQRRLTAAEEKHGKSSTQYSNALLSVQRRQLDVESSSNRYSLALRKVEKELLAVGGSGDRVNGSIGRLAGGFARLGSSMASLPSIGGRMARTLTMIAVLLPVLTAGVGYLTTGISALSAGILSLLGPLSSLSGLLATLPQGFMVAGGAIATFIGAFSGIGDALKAGAEAANEAGAAATDLAKREKAAARAIKDAQRGVADARRRAAESARQNARAVEQASRALVDAQKREYEAAKALSSARQQARRDLMDMKDALRDLELAERGAALGVEEAKRRLDEVMRDPFADDLSRAQAQLAYDEAVARMDDVEKQQRRATKEQKEAAKKGVEGSDVVVQALENERAAQEAVQEAQRGLAEARRQQAQAARDSARAVADAQRAVRDAQEAANESMEAGASAANKYQQALDNLSPAGQRFVKLLLGMRDEMKRLRFAAQEGLLPGVGEALTILLKLVPFAEKALFRFGQVIGQVAVEAATLLTSDSFMPMWNRLLESNLRLLRMAGDGFLNLLEAVVYLMDAAAPFTEWLSGVVLGWTEYWKELAKAENETGKLADTLMGPVRQSLETFGGIFKNLFRTFKNIGKAGWDLGSDLLESFERITAGWVEWTGSVEGQNSLKEWFDAARAPLHQMRLLLGDLMRGIFDIGKASGDDLAKFIEILRSAGPALKDVMINLQGDFGQGLAELFVNLVEIFAKLTASGEGGLTTFVDGLVLFTDAISRILDNEGVTKVIGEIAKVLAIMAVIKLTGIGAALGLLINVFRRFGTVYKVLKKMDIGGIFKNILKVIASVAKGVGKWLARLSILLRANPWGLLVTALIIAVGLIWKYWDEIVDGVQKFVKVVADFVKKNWDVIKWFLGPMGLLIDLIVKHWDKIKKVFTKAIDSIKGFVKRVWPTVAKFLVDPVDSSLTALRKLWDKISGGFSNLWKNIKGSANKFKNAIGGIWEKITSAFATPIEFIINTMLNDWIIGNINKVLGFLGIKEGIEHKDVSLKSEKAKRYARGGMVPGQGNVDSVPAVLMPGEFVLRKDAVQSIGVSNLRMLNERRGFRRYNLGGLVDGIGGAIGGGFGVLKDAAGSAIDMGREGAAIGLDKALGAAASGLRAAIPGDSIIDDIGVGMLNKIREAAVAFVRGKEAATWGHAGTVTGGEQMDAYTHARLRLPSFGWPVSEFVPLQQLWQRESGWNYQADNSSSSAYGIPQGMVGTHRYSMPSNYYGRVTSGSWSDPKTLNFTGGDPKAQIDWGLGYIKRRYGSPTNAWAHSQRTGWYNTGGKVRRFATGGRSKWREPVPAMLTPGEFVLNRDAVARVGSGNLEDLNRSGSRGGKIFLRRNVGGRRGRPRVPIQKFHRGGVVKGMRPGAAGTWVKALEYLFGTKTDGTWDPQLDRKMRGKFLPPQKNQSITPAYRVNANAARSQQFVNWLDKPKVKRVHRNKKYKVQPGDRVGDVLKLFYGAKNYEKHLNAFLKANGFQKTVTKKQQVEVKIPGGAAGGSLGKAQAFAKSQSGKPYIWGGVGPKGYDCSGFQSAIINVLKGRNPHSRLFATSNMASVLPGLGFHRGNGDYTVGWYTGNPGHTSGRIGNMNAESTNGHVRVGGAARSPNSFPNVMGLNVSGGGGGGGTKTVTKKRKVKVGTKKLSDRLKAGEKVNVPNVPGWEGAKTWQQARQRFNLTNPQLVNFLAQVQRTKAFKNLAKPKKADILQKFGVEQKAMQTAFKALNNRMGLKGKEEIRWNSQTKKAFQHVFAHAHSQKHPDLMFRPWKANTPLENILLGEIDFNKKMVEWESAMTRLAAQGYKYLIDYLFDLGMDDGLPIAKEAANKPHLAKRLEEELKKKAEFNDEDLRAFIKLVSFVNSTNKVLGLRDIARGMQYSDLEAVLLWEKAQKAGRLGNIPLATMNRVNEDIRQYRGGTFYANTGGQVPGHGNTDSVPAMLTPGEFVIRKEAAKALGLENLWALNNVQKFATGGPVLAPSVSALPSAVASKVSAKNLSGSGITYNTEITYDVDIHNPIAEPSTRSLTKALQRQSFFGPDGGGNSVVKRRGEG